MARKSTSNNHHRHQHSLLLLIKYAIASRLTLVTLTILWRSLLTPYDTSASLNPPCLSTTNSTNRHALLPRVGSAIENGIVWDAVYFVRIAECGYEYEHYYAFLPLLPLSISLLSNTIFAPLVPVIGYRAVLALSGYFINNVVFVFATLYLYRLSLVVLKDREVALRASILFCFNPASIFYSTVYTESLYAFLSFGGLCHFMNGEDYYSSFWFALSGFARSNGIINAGYICFRTMLGVHQAFFSRKEFLMATKIIVSGALCCLCIFAPFISFQAYGYFNICLGQSADRLRPWCKARLPLLYNYIQSHYWGVGFLKYFQVKQLPNFLLASPILSLALFSIIYYIKRQPEVFLSLGFRASSVEKELVVSPFTIAEAGSSTAVYPETVTSNLSQDSRTVRLRKKATSTENLVPLPSKSESQDTPQYIPVHILPFVLHLSFMLATAFFVMHVQVATRFLSASPVLYWYASYIMGSHVVGKKAGHLIWGYCAAYILLGSLLFTNFYPFT